MREEDIEQMKVKPIKYTVQCIINEKHVFEKVFRIQEGSEAVESEVEAFCPFCQNPMTVKIKGIPVKEDVLTRSLEHPGIE